MAKKPKKKKKAAVKAKHAKVALKRYKIEDLEDAPYNSRMITQNALAGLANSLEDFGLLSLPVVNERKEGPRIVGGHQRINVLRERGDTHVYAIAVELDDTLEKRANFSLNNEAIQGTFVPDLAKALIDKLREFSGGDSKESPFYRLNLDTLLKKVSRRLSTHVPVLTTPVDDDDENDVEQVARKTKAASKPGQYYRLGEHIVLCEEIQAKGTLLGFPVEIADMAFTRIAQQKEILGSFLDAQLGHLIENTGGGIYIVTNLESLAQIQRRFLVLNGHWSSTLIWMDRKAKPSDNVAYRDATIPVLYGWPEGESHVFFGEPRISNIFDLSRSPKFAVPVEVAVRAILLSSEEGHTVLDTDLDTGSTLIAAERTKRKVVGYARTAHQCDTVRKRWAVYVHGKGAAWKSLTPVVA